MGRRPADQQGNGKSGFDPTSKTLTGPSHTEVMAPDDIVISKRLRTLNEEAVLSLMESIRKIGLQTPITVRLDEDRQVFLVAGLHRLEACRRLGIEMMDCWVFDGPDTDVRLWEISENLHRADLTTLERSEHIAEWVRLTEEKLKSAQVEPKSKTAANPRGSGRQESGINSAVRQLGIERNEAQRAVKIDGLSPQAKQTAQNLGLANNQRALLDAAKSKVPEKQVEILSNRNAVTPPPPPPKSPPPPAIPARCVADDDGGPRRRWMASMTQLWNEGTTAWRLEFLQQVQPPPGPHGNADTTDQPPTKH